MKPCVSDTCVYDTVCVWYRVCMIRVCMIPCVSDTCVSDTCVSDTVCAWYVCVWYRVCLIPCVFDTCVCDTVCVWYRVCLIPCLSDTVCVWYRVCLIPCVSDTVCLWYRVYNKPSQNIYLHVGSLGICNYSLIVFKWFTHKLIQLKHVKGVESRVFWLNNNSPLVHAVKLSHRPLDIKTRTLKRRVFGSKQLIAM